MITKIISPKPLLLNMIIVTLQLRVQLKLPNILQGSVNVLIQNKVTILEIYNANGT